MSVSENISNGKYNVSDEIARAAFPTQYNLPKHDTKEDFMQARKAFHAEQSRLMKVFQADLAEEFDIDESISDRVFNEAWERGHSAGIHEVYSAYVDIVDFINDILKVMK